MGINVSTEEIGELPVIHGQGRLGSARKETAAFSTAASFDSKVRASARNAWLRAPRLPSLEHLLCGFGCQALICKEYDNINYSANPSRAAGVRGERRTLS